MATCTFCGGDYPQERADIGKDYCTRKPCVDQGLARKQFMEVGHNKSGVDLKPVTAESFEELKTTGNRGRS